MMKKIFSLLSILISAFTTQLHAQADFWNSPDAYLGQKQPGSIPEIFAPGILADTPYFSASRVAFTADGKEIYYCYNKSWANNEYLKIKYFKYENGKWNGPFTVNEHYNGPTFSVDGKTLYFNGHGGLGFQSHRTAGGWSEPEAFFPDYIMYDCVPVNSGIIYTASNQYIGAEQRPRNVDVSTITITGKDTVVKTLGVPVNAPGWNGDFFVARDESFLILSAKEDKSNNCELYISYRKPDKTWTNPKSLGANINNGVSHRYGQYVTADKKFLFYCYGHDEKDCAVYWVRFDRIYDSLKHTNFEPYVYDSLKNQSVAVGKTFSIQVPAKTFVDDDGNNTLVYTAQLADGGALPTWIHFDPAKKIISGNATAAGNYDITIIVTDKANAQASSTLTLTCTQN